MVFLLLPFLWSTGVGHSLGLPESLFSKGVPAVVGTCNCNVAVLAMLLIPMFC